jgi:hypothetical protein
VAAAVLKKSDVSIGVEEEHRGLKQGWSGAEVDPGVEWH